jgi:hypothetical protein
LNRQDAKVAKKKFNNHLFLSPGALGLALLASWRFVSLFSRPRNENAPHTLALR